VQANWLTHRGYDVELIDPTAPTAPGSRRPAPTCSRPAASAGWSTLTKPHWQPYRPRDPIDEILTS